MNQLQKHSEALLNAFLDNELGEIDSNILLDELRDNGFMCARLGKLQCTRSMLRHAYQSVTLPNDPFNNLSTQKQSLHSNRRSPLVASLSKLVDYYSPSRRRK